MEFKFFEFNPRRAQRGAPAALMEYDVDGNVDWTWFDKTDIREARETYGPSDELDKAMAAYKKGGAE